MRTRNIARSVVQFLLMGALGCAAISQRALPNSAALGARIVLKPDIDAKCREARLKECETLTEGILLFAEGKEEDGKVRLRIAATANSPESVTSLARAISAIGEIPGTSQYMQPLLDAAHFLETPVPSVVGQAMQATYEQPSTPRPESLPAAAAQPATMERDLLEGMATPLANPAAAHCGAGGISALCVRVAPGPLTVTGIFEIGKCRDSAIALVAHPDGDLGSPRWAVSVTPSAPTLSGITLKVEKDESLYLALPSSPSQDTSRQCAITWSGYRTPGARTEVVASQAAPQAEPPATEETARVGAAPAEEAGERTERKPRTVVVPAMVEDHPSRVAIAQAAAPSAPLSAVPARLDEQQGAVARDAEESTITKPPEPSPTASKGPASVPPRFTITAGSGYSHWSFGGPFDSDSSLFASPSLALDYRLDELEEPSAPVIFVEALSTATFGSQSTAVLNTLMLGLRYDPDAVPLRGGVSVGPALASVPGIDGSRQEFGIAVQPFLDFLLGHGGAGIRLSGLLGAAQGGVLNLGIGIKGFLDF